MKRAGPDVNGQYRGREMGHAKAPTAIDGAPDVVASDSPAQRPLQQLSQPLQSTAARFLRIAGVAAATASLAPASALAMLTAPAKPRHLKFYNLHTSEKLDIVLLRKRDATSHRRSPRSITSCATTARTLLSR